jgi:hypothetical protein
MSPDEIKGIAKSILNSVSGGMEGPDIAELAMLLVSVLVFQTPIGRREEVSAELRRGFQAAIAEGEIRGDLRRALKQ